VGVEQRLGRGAGGWVEASPLAETIGIAAAVAATVTAAAEAKKAAKQVGVGKLGVGKLEVGKLGVVQLGSAEGKVASTHDRPANRGGARVVGSAATRRCTRRRGGGRRAGRWSARRKRATGMARTRGCGRRRGWCCGVWRVDMHREKQEEARGGEGGGGAARTRRKINWSASAGCERSCARTRLGQPCAQQRHGSAPRACSGGCVGRAEGGPSSPACVERVLI